MTHCTSIYHSVSVSGVQQEWIWPLGHHKFSCAATDPITDITSYSSADCCTDHRTCDSSCRRTNGSPAGAPNYVPPPGSTAVPTSPKVIVPRKAPTDGPVTAPTTSRPRCEKQIQRTLNHCDPKSGGRKTDSKGRSSRARDQRCDLLPVEVKVRPVINEKRAHTLAVRDTSTGGCETNLLSKLNCCCALVVTGLGWSSG
jgi:hypothetical protein